MKTKYKDHYTRKADQVRDVQSVSICPHVHERAISSTVVGAWGGCGALLGVADDGGEGGRAAGGVLEGGEVVVEV